MRLLFWKRFDTHFTLVIIPNNEGEVRRLSVPGKLLLTFVICAGLLILAILTASYEYWSSRQDLANVRAIKAENEEKAKALEAMSERLLELEKKNMSLENKQEQIKKIMGINENPESGHSVQPSRGGVGGVMLQRYYRSPEILNLEADLLDNRQQRQLQTAEELLRIAREKADYFRSMPNYWPVIGEITSGFGWRKNPFGRGEEYHHGLDIAADRGTPVRAAADGTVIYAAWKKGYGRLIIVKHQNGLATWYGHNSAIKVKVGDRVKKGQVISEVGSSGRSTGPHVHFEIQKNGQSINPLLYLP